MTRLPLAWAVLLSVQGCTTYCKVLSIKVESVTEPNVILRLDVDRDLEGEDWKEHVIRFDHVILNEERLARLRQFRPEVPPRLEEAGPALIEDYNRELFDVFARWEKGGESKPPGGEESKSDKYGRIDPGSRVGESRWSYRIAIPFRRINHNTYRDPDHPDYRGPGAYELKPGGEYRLWGRIFGALFIGERQLSSDVCTLGFTIPSK